MSDYTRLQVTNNPKSEGTVYDSDNYYLTAEQQRELNNHGSVGVSIEQHKNYKHFTHYEGGKKTL